MHFINCQVELNFIFVFLKMMIMKRRRGRGRKKEKERQCTADNFQLPTRMLALLQTIAYSIQQTCAKRNYILIAFKWFIFPFSYRFLKAKSTKLL
jgi:hypothetical protein